MKTQIESVKQTAIDKLNDGIGEGDAGDLHHFLFNEDDFIIGTYQAKQWLGEDVFDAIEKIKTYENDNFGEVNTDFSDPEKVVNMLAYVLGEEILQGSEVLQDKWNEQLNTDDLKAIAKELEA